MTANSTPATVISISPARGRLLILLAAVLWSTSGLFAKSPVFDSWPPEVRGLVLAFWRALFAAALLLPLVRRPRFRPALVPMSCIFAAMNVAFLSAMIFTTAGNTIWLQHTAPVWVLVLSVLVLREKVAPRSLMLLAFGMSGVAVILTGELSAAAIVTGGRQGLGVLLALASGFTYALVVLFLRALRGEDSAWLIAVNLLVTAAILAPLVIYLAVTRDVRPTWTQLAVLACFGLFQLGLPYVLFARGLQVTTSGEAAGMVLIEPLLTPLWVFMVWGEPSRWWTILGGALILTGLAINLLRAPRSPVAES